MVDERSLRRCVVVAVQVTTILALCATHAPSQLQHRTITALPASALVLEAEAGDPVLFYPLQPLDLKIDQRGLKDGSYIGILTTGLAGDIWYVDVLRNGSPGEIPKVLRTKIVIEGQAPRPPPKPEPDIEPETELTGLAKQIYETALPLNDPETAHEISVVFGRALKDIEDEKLTKAEDVHTQLKQQMPVLPKEWKPVGDLISQALNKYAQNLRGAELTLRAVEEGLAEI